MHAVHLNAARLAVITWIDWGMDDLFFFFLNHWVTRLDIIQKSTYQCESSLSVNNQGKKRLCFFIAVRGQISPL